MPKPLITAYAAYYQKYIDLIPEEDLAAAFRNQLPVIQELLSSISEEKSTFAYAEGKWTIRELLQHVIDTERVFSYRALCFARKDTTPLPGFDENDYASHSHASNRSWQSLADEFLAVRRSTELLFGSFPDHTLLLAGTANNNPLSVVAAGFITIGHFYHHKNILEERYL